MNPRILAISITLTLWLILTGCDGTQKGGEQAPSGPVQGQEAPAVDVGYIELRPVDISRTNELPGRVVAYRVAEIRPQVSGVIQARMFEEGSHVEEGQQLYQIDPARYEADYQMAKANLQDARARMENARLDFNRLEDLLAENAISQQEYDDALSRLNQTEAAVGLAEAEVQRAQIDLDYTRVHSPISGYIGPSAVTQGALVTAQQEFALATVRQLDPVYVDLSQAAVQAGHLLERLTEISANDREKTDFPVTVYLGNSARSYPHEGTLDATDLVVDPRTGSIRLRSIVPNPDRILLPGMFVRASIEGVGRSSEIVVPQKSVRIEPGGEKSVWVIGPDDTASKRSIRTGAAYDSDWVVLDGLEAGDRLIVEGTIDLSEGVPVKPEKIAGYHEQLEKEVPPDTLKERAPPPDVAPRPSSGDPEGKPAAADKEELKTNSARHP